MTIHQVYLKDIPKEHTNSQLDTPTVNIKSGTDSFGEGSDVRKWFNNYAYIIAICDGCMCHSYVILVLVVMS